MDGRVRMAPLTWVAGAFRARVLAARLESEGIDAQLRGAVEGPYGLTVGDLARVDVYVPEDQLADARYVLLADEIDDTLTAPSDWWDAGSERTASPAHRGPAHHGPAHHGMALRWMAGLLLAIALLGTVLGAARHW